MKQKNRLWISSFIVMSLTLMLGFTLKTQAQSFTIKFEASGGAALKIDRVLVENLNQGTSVTLNGSDILRLGAVGINKINSNNESVIVYPNPMQGQAELFFTSEAGNVRVAIYDINSKVVVTTNTVLEQGRHSYQIKNLKQGIYLINVIGPNYSYTTKLVSQYATQNEASLTYLGIGKVLTGQINLNNNIGEIDLAYSSGDELRFTGYSGSYISQINDVPTSSKTISFEFLPNGGTLKTPWSCGNPVHVIHTAGNVAPVNKDIWYGTVTNIPGEPTKCWITSNLGADHQATGINDATEASAGWYWQFNRQRGFKHTGIIRTPNTPWITSIVENSNWTFSQDPCRIEMQGDWRIPTYSEWTNVEANWNNPWTSGLYLHHAGLLGLNDGNLYNRGSSGLYWSSTQDDEYHGAFLRFDWGPDVHRNKTYGFPLRCISDNCKTADAGPDQKVCGTSTTLAGNDPAPGIGLWTVISGTGGSFADATLYNTSFTGMASTVYVLRWTISSHICAESYDDVYIKFASAPCISDAGPDQMVNGTTTTLAGNDPTPCTGLWTIISGAGGTLSNATAYNSAISGTSGTTYTLRWTVSYPGCPDSYDDVVITFQSTNACPGVPTVTYEGQVYNTVLIGNQCWLKENLNVGVRIPGAQSQDGSNGIKEKYCYNDLDSNCTIYGGLYKWAEAMQGSTTPGAQGICPTGWHVPTDGEWTILTTYLGGITVAGGALKEAGYVHWAAPNGGATNSSEFTGLPGGAGGNNFNFISLGTMGYWWSSNLSGLNYAGNLGLNYTSPGTGLAYYWIEGTGTSVRCIKNDTCATPPGAPTPGTHIPSPTQIIWNWNTVYCATGYKWNTFDDYSSAIDMVSATSNTETGLCCNTAYTRYVWAYNSYGHSASTALTQTTSVCSPCSGIPTVTYEGHIYNTVQIGTQCWFKENLNVGTMIPVDQESTNDGTIEKYCYGDNPDNCNTYGGLYQWNEAMEYSNTPGAQGICPAGWHIPTDAEWCTLTTYLDATVNCNVTTWSGTDAGGKMKETGTTHWFSPNTGATNCSGFTALPGGIRSGDGSYGDLTINGCFWTSTLLPPPGDGVWRRIAGYNHSDIMRYGHAKNNGNSVRCIKD